MPRVRFAAALAATIAAVPATFAAEANQAAPMSPMTTNSSITTTRLHSGQIRGSDIKGAAVYDSQDRKVASVRDMVLDADGRIAQVIVDVDGRHVAVDMAQLMIAADHKNKPHIAVEMTKDQLRAAEPFDLDARPASGSSAPPAQKPR